MKNTPNLGIPYPEPADPPRGADQMQGIAERVDKFALIAVRSDTSGQSPVGGNRWNRLATPEITGHAAWVSSGDGGLVVPTDGLYQVSGQLNVGENGFTMAIGGDAGGQPAEGYAMAWTGAYTNLAMIVANPTVFTKGQKVYLWAYPGTATDLLWGWMGFQRVGDLPVPDKIPTRTGPTY